MSSRLPIVACMLLACSSPPLSRPAPPSRSDAAVRRAPQSLDSARAVALACDVVQQLRSTSQETTCRGQSAREEADGFTVRVHETSSGGAPLDFPYSIVKLAKDSANVTVSRIPIP